MNLIPRLENETMNILTFRIAKLIVAAAISVASLCYAEPTDFTYSDWQQTSEQWKRGYVYAVMNFQTQIKQNTSKEHMRMLMGYRACINGKLTDAAFVTAMDNYIIRHPEAMTLPIIGVALNTLLEICSPYLGNK